MKVKLFDNRVFTKGGELTDNDFSDSLPLEMLDSLEEMNVLIGHLIDEKLKFYSNDKKQIRNMQELIGKARKHYSR